MKKYLLIIESKKYNYVTYELYDSYDELIEEVELAHDISDGDVITKWFRIDNLNNESLKILKILKTLNCYIAKNLR